MALLLAHLDLFHIAGLVSPYLMHPDKLWCIRFLTFHNNHILLCRPCTVCAGFPLLRELKTLFPRYIKTNPESGTFRFRQPGCIFWVILVVLVQLGYYTFEMISYPMPLLFLSVPLPPLHYLLIIW